MGLNFTPAYKSRYTAHAQPPNWQDLLTYSKHLQNQKRKSLAHYLDHENVSRWCNIITSQHVQDGKTTAMLKIFISLYLSEKSFAFDEIWYTTADLKPNDIHATIMKNNFTKIQDGTTAILKVVVLVIAQLISSRLFYFYHISIRKQNSMAMEVM